ncbi:MAG: thioredoxin domain-containing protein [Novosphingobium sp.]|nr:thioredoxin domain-containing protein [Novosphingobium sp.]
MKIASAFAGLSAAVALTAAALPATAQTKANWTATVKVEADGTHTLGNPEAKVQLSEFVSYTCSHCANFEKASDAPLRLAYVMPGKVSVRVVHLTRDSVDLAAALLTNCGDADGFFARHHMFLSSQDKWMAKIEKATTAQEARWNGEDMAASMRAIASDAGFYDMMAHRGVDRAAANRCLGDTAMARTILEQRKEAARLGVPGTPSFASEGKLLDQAYDWPSLDATLKSML